MTRLRAATFLLLVQLILVSTVAAKYLYERRICPRVWAPSAQYDPNLPLRGRYLSLQVLVDACHLPRDSAHVQQYMPYGVRPSVRTADYWTWYVSLAAETAISCPSFRTTQGIRRTPYGSHLPMTIRATVFLSRNRWNTSSRIARSRPFLSSRARNSGLKSPSRPAALQDPFG